MEGYKRERERGRREGMKGKGKGEEIKWKGKIEVGNRGSYEGNVSIHNHTKKERWEKKSSSKKRQTKLISFCKIYMVSWARIGADHDKHIGDT